MTLNIQIEESN